MKEQKVRFTEIETVINRFSRLIKSAILKTCAQIDPADLQDLEQEVAIKIWKELSKSEKTIDNLGSYIWRVAFTTTCRLMKSSYKQKTVSLDEPLIAKEIQDLAKDCSPVTPAALYAREELQQVLEAEVNSLINSRRQVVKLYLMGMEREEIVAFFGWSENKVRNLLYRGLADLKDKFKKKNIQIEV